MKKVPFSQEGLNLKIEMLNALPKDEFKSEIVKLEFETKDWVSSNFELNEEQIKYLSGVPENLITYLGFQSATAIVTGQEIVLETPSNNEVQVAGRKSIKTKIEGSDTWNWNEEPPRIKFKWSVSISYSF